MSERRIFQRVPFATGAEIICGRNKYSGELLDISLLGALVEGNNTIPLEKGGLCEMTIHLADSEISMSFEVTLVHRRDNRFGFKFTSSDTETMTHLKRLLELNIGSSESLDKEIALWLKEH